MKKQIYLSLGLAALLAMVGGVSVYAATPLSGYAWSSTIGWVSFNASDGSTVSMSTTTSTGTLSGYAWSPNIGWIKFGGLSGQTVGGITTSDATVNLGTGAVSGWARACAGTVGGDCASASRTDGWDGWIELAGTNHQTVTGLSGTATSSQGVSYNNSNGAFSGYAWGGPVVGWLQFNTSGSTAVSVGCTGPNCGGQPNTTLSASCSPSSNTSLTSPGNVTFTASAHEVTGGSSSYGNTYDYSWDGGNTWGSSSSFVETSGPSGSTVPGPILVVRDHSNNSIQSAASPNCGSITVSNANGSGGISLKIGKPGSSLTSSLRLIQGNPFVLKWDTTGLANPSSNSCSASVNSSQPDWSSWPSEVITPGIASSTTFSTGNGDATNNYTFTISCTSNAGSSNSMTVSSSVTLDLVSSSFREF